MPNNKKTVFSEKDIDNLLNQAFLNLDFNNPKNKKLMETIATQNLMNENALAYSIKKNIFNKFIITGILTVAITTAIVFIKNTSHKTSIITELAYTAIIPKKSISSINQESQIVNEDAQIKSPKETNIKTAIVFQKTTNSPLSDDLFKGSFFEQNQQEPIINNTIILTENKKLEDSSYVFPTLT